MKKLYFCLLCTGLYAAVRAQNIFPATGKVGIGTTAPAALLQVKNGSSRFGSNANYAGIDSVGNLSFKGDATYKIGGNKYIFQYADNPAVGIFFNSTSMRYEFRNGSAIIPFTLYANDGTAWFGGNLLANSNGVIDIGSGTNGWKDIYMYGSMYRGVTKILNFDLSSIALGANTLASNVSGINNIAIGANALNKNKKGNNLIAIGESALSKNTIGFQNTAIGYNALLSNTSGYDNLAAGYQALLSNTTGISNIANGSFALYYNTAGNANVATGVNALIFNTTGSDNTASGNSALNFNKTGNANTAYGSRALYLNSTGYSNVAVGKDALFSNITSNNIVAVGDSALYNNGIGASPDQASGNTAVGSKALYSNNTGFLNTATGYQTLFLNTTGVQNTADGYQALVSNVTGTTNTASGYEAGYSNIIGSGNTAIGAFADFYSTDGQGNTAVGVSAGNYRHNGSYNTFIGAYSTATADGYQNSVGLGYGSNITASFQIRLGNSNTQSIGGYVNWSNISDGRYKKNMKDNVPGLAFINSLKPLTYNLDINGINSFMQKNRPSNADRTSGNKAILNNKMPAADAASIVRKEAVLYSGFVAQDVEKAAKNLGYDFSGVDAPKNDNDLYGLRYSDFVVPLVKAVQELSAKVDRLEKQLGTQQVSSAVTQSNNGNIKIMIDDNAASKLGQNIPNPFEHSTTIPFSISKDNKTASIVITQAGSGAVVKTININGSGTQAGIDAGSLSNGSYIYTLYVDGKKVDSKQMLLKR